MKAICIVLASNLMAALILVTCLKSWYHLNKAHLPIFTDFVKAGSQQSNIIAPLSIQVWYMHSCFFAQLLTYARAIYLLAVHWTFIITTLSSLACRFYDLVSIITSLYICPLVRWYPVSFRAACNPNQAQIYAREYKSASKDLRQSLGYRIPVKIKLFKKAF